MNFRLPIRVAVAPLGAQIAQSGCQACIALNGLGRSPERTAMLPLFPSAPPARSLLRLGQLSFLKSDCGR